MSCRLPVNGFLLSVGFGFVLCLAACSPRQSSTQAELLKWNEATLVKAYDKVGRRNPKWDQPARRALSEFAKIRAGKVADTELLLGMVADLAEQARQAGCDDPMVRYLYCRDARASDNTLEGWQREFRSMAQSMQSSGYPPIRKFYADLRAANVLWEGRNTNLWPEVHQFRMTAVLELTQALEDKSMPIQEVSAAAGFLLNSIARSEYELTNGYYAIEKPLFRNWPHAAASYFIKTKFYYEYAWRARGGGYANQVRAERWKLFFARIKEAEAALDKAWVLDPKDPSIPTFMIQICRSGQKPREEMETWFRRAMQLDTNNYAACYYKLLYLLPQWYGSRADMLSFGRECVASTNWGGRVPLILVDAHWNLARRLRSGPDRAQYWLRPEVWPDLHAAYEKFFQLNPKAQGYRAYYTRYAYWCHQWKDFLEQARILKQSYEDVDYRFFGGREAFEQMIESAQKRSAGG